MTAIWLIFGAMSLLTLLLYYTDKCKAQRGSWRIPEKTLLLFSALGGATGGLLAMYLFHHKTRKWYFKFGVPIILLLHIALVVFIKTHM